MLVTLRHVCAGDEDGRDILAAVFVIEQVDRGLRREDLHTSSVDSWNKVLGDRRVSRQSSGNGVLGDMQIKFYCRG
jgi:hypothetical protein